MTQPLGEIPTSNSTRKPVLIVGAGISGIACARELRDHGVPFKIINKGMKIGGRMASKSVRDSERNTTVEFLISVRRISP